MLEEFDERRVSRRREMTMERIRVIGAMRRQAASSSSSSSPSMSRKTNSTLLSKSHTNENSHNTSTLTDFGERVAASQKDLNELMDRLLVIQLQKEYMDDIALDMNPMALTSHAFSSTSNVVPNFSEHSVDDEELGLALALSLSMKEFDNLIETENLDYESLLELEDVKVGIDKNKLLLVTSAISNKELDQIGNEKCTVCLDELGNTSGQTVQKVNICNHAFHRECLFTWLEKSKQCPLCKERLVE